MSRLAVTREDLDDDHLTAAAWTGAGQHAGLIGCGLLLLGLNNARRSTKQLTSACDIGSTIAVGEQAVVTDAMEALR